MTDAYRVLVTGSRDWTDRDAVDDALYGAYRTAPWDQVFVIVHGDCSAGADAMAKRWAQRWSRYFTPNIIHEPHPANWRPHGVYNPQAGPLRNRQMVDAGADLCLAFIKNGSRGATGCADLAEAAGIPTRRWTA